MTRTCRFRWALWPERSQFQEQDQGLNSCPISFYIRMSTINDYSVGLVGVCDLQPWLCKKEGNKSVHFECVRIPITALDIQLWPLHTCRCTECSVQMSPIHNNLRFTTAYIPVHFWRSIDCSIKFEHFQPIVRSVSKNTVFSHFPTVVWTVLSRSCAELALCASFEKVQPTDSAFGHFQQFAELKIHAPVYIYCKTGVKYMTSSKGWSRVKNVWSNGAHILYLNTWRWTMISNQSKSCRVHIPRELKRAIPTIWSSTCGALD